MLGYSCYDGSVQLAYPLSYDGYYSEMLEEIKKLSPIPYKTEITDDGLDLIINLPGINPKEITITSDGTHVKVDVESLGVLKYSDKCSGRALNYYESTSSYKYGQLVISIPFTEVIQITIGE
ncbi:MAG: Hsp20/alpha crystallin family protein [Nitrososphaeraceae archaeon]|nr:Hsp20/alpha crystallin family protein [Nitrososphaeraceae archaeon]